MDKEFEYLARFLEAALRGGATGTEAIDRASQCVRHMIWAKNHLKMESEKETDALKEAVKEIR